MIGREARKGWTLSRGATVERAIAYNSPDLPKGKPEPHPVGDCEKRRNLSGPLTKGTGRGARMLLRSSGRAARHRVG